jgi:hypothetical protein
MAGRSKKPGDQIAFEKSVSKRLRQIRKDQFPDDGEMESRRKFAEGAGLVEAAYEKMEQRGALSGYAVMMICATYGINPFELLGIPSIGDHLSTSSMRLAMINQRLSEEHQKQLLKAAQQFPARPIVKARNKKPTTEKA